MKAAAKTDINGLPDWLVPLVFDRSRDAALRDPTLDHAENVQPSDPSRLPPVAD